MTLKLIIGNKNYSSWSFRPWVAMEGARATLEYLAEKFPNAGLWPAESAARAHARSIANEMHAGFLALRRLMPMNMWRPVIKRELTPEAAANVARIEAMWSESRARFGGTRPV